MSLIPMNVEQMRRKAIENAKAKQQKQKDFENQVNQMSRHNVGSNLDVREIIKSKQFKEQKNYYDPHQAEQEFRDMFQSYGLYSDADGWIDYLKKTRGSSANAIDSFQLRELGKKLSDTFENFKQKQKDEKMFANKGKGLIQLLNKIEMEGQTDLVFNILTTSLFTSNKKFDTPTTGKKTIIGILTALQVDAVQQEKGITNNMISLMLRRYKSSPSDTEYLAKLERLGFFSEESNQRYDDLLYRGNARGVVRKDNPFIRFEDGATWSEKEKSWVIKNVDGENENGFRMYGSPANKDARELYASIRNDRNEPTSLRPSNKESYKTYSSFFEQIMDTEGEKSSPLEVNEDFFKTPAQLFDNSEATLNDRKQRFFEISMNLLQSYRQLEKIQKIQFEATEDTITIATDGKKEELGSQFSEADYREILRNSNIKGANEQEKLIKEAEMIYQVLDILGASNMIRNSNTFKKLQTFNFKTFDLFTDEEEKSLIENDVGEKIIQLENDIEEYRTFTPNRKKSYDKLKEMYDEYMNEDDEPNEGKDIAKALRRINRKKTMLEGLL